ncbi:MAG: XF1762 family protein [Desulfotomaculales bacterium]
MMFAADWSGQLFFCDHDPRPAAARELYVRPVPYGVARRFVETHHYLRYAPFGAKISLGVYYREHLVGVMMFTHPCARFEDQEHTLELSRMVLLDCCPRNSESRSLGLAARWVKRNMPQIRRMVTYADPAQGHRGTIYRAAGWRFLGNTEGRPWSHSRRVRRDAAVGRKLKFELILHR